MKKSQAEQPYLHILFPVLNEEKRLERGIRKTIRYLEKIGFSDYELTIVDNGSEDRTQEIALDLCKSYENLSYLRIEERGVGAAFRAGAKGSRAPVLGYMDIDLSTDIRHLKETIRLFKERPSLDYLNDSRFAHASRTIGRKWYRQLSSYGLLFLLKLVFHMRATDAVCGYTFVRKEVCERLINECTKENGWFYMIEFLLRAERDGMHILDYPVRWQEDYNTTVRYFKTIFNYLKNIARLSCVFHTEEAEKRRNHVKAHRSDKR